MTKNNKFIQKSNTKSYNLYYKLDKNVYYIYYNMVYDLDKNHKIINLRGNIMFKKAVSLMLVFSIIGFGMGIKVDALSKSNDEPIMVTSEKYMVSEGQIDLDGIDLELNSNGELELNVKNRKSSTQTELNELNEHFEEVPELKEKLIKDLEKNEDISIKAIGYTDVMVKKIETEDGNEDMVPVSKNEYYSTYAFSQGQNSVFDGYFRLYTIGESCINGSNKELYGASLSKWIKQSSVSDKYRPAAYEDSISVSLPSRYTIYSKKLSTEYAVSNRCTLDTKTGVSYAFVERPSSYTNGIKWAELGVTGKTSNKNTVYEKISSSYVHTYGKVTVTPSLNSSGTVSFSLSNTSYAWTIASSVSANF